MTGTIIQMKSPERLYWVPGSRPSAIARTAANPAAMAAHAIHPLVHPGEALHFEGTVLTTVEDAAAYAVKRFYERLMSPLLDLSQGDINSLDGSPSAAPALNTLGN